MCIPNCRAAASRYFLELLVLLPRTIKLLLLFSLCFTSLTAHAQDGPISVAVTVRLGGANSSVPFSTVPFLRRNDVLQVGVSGCQPFRSNSFYCINAPFTFGKTGDAYTVVAAFIPQVGNVFQPDKRTFPDGALSHDGSKIEFKVPNDGLLPYIFLVPAQPGQMSDAVHFTETLFRDNRTQLTKGPSDTITDGGNPDQVSNHLQQVVNFLKLVDQETAQGQAQHLTSNQIEQKLVTDLGVSTTQAGNTTWVESLLSLLTAPTLPTSAQLNTAISDASQFIPFQFKIYLQSIAAVLNQIIHLINPEKKIEYLYTVYTVKSFDNDADAATLSLNPIASTAPDGIKHVLMCPLGRTDIQRFTESTAVDGVFYWVPSGIARHHVLSVAAASASTTGQDLPITFDQIELFGQDPISHQTDFKIVPLHGAVPILSNAIPVALDDQNHGFTIPDQSSLPTQPTTMALFGNWGSQKNQQLSQPFMIRAIQPITVMVPDLQKQTLIANSPAQVGINLITDSDVPLLDPQNDIWFEYTDDPAQMGIIHRPSAPPTSLSNNPGYQALFDMVAPKGLCKAGVGKLHLREAGLIDSSVVMRVFDKVPTVQRIIVHAYDKSLSLQGLDFQGDALPKQVILTSGVVSIPFDRDDSPSDGKTYSFTAASDAATAPLGHFADDGSRIPISVLLSDGRTLTDVGGVSDGIFILPRAPTVNGIALGPPSTSFSDFSIPGGYYPLGSDLTLTFTADRGYKFSPGTTVKIAHQNDTDWITLTPSPAINSTIGVASITVTIPANTFAKPGTLQYLIADPNPRLSGPDFPSPIPVPIENLCMIHLPDPKSLQLTNLGNNRYRISGTKLDTIQSVETDGMAVQSVLATPEGINQTIDFAMSQTNTPTIVLTPKDADISITWKPVPIPQAAPIPQMNG